MPFGRPVVRENQTLGQISPTNKETLNPFASKTRCTPHLNENASGTRELGENASKSMMHELGSAKFVRC